jgi:hypothetical protein
LQVHENSVGSELGLLVVLVNLPGQVWHIDTSVGFTRDKELVGEVLGEFDEPLFKGGESVLGLNHIIG